MSEVTKMLGCALCQAMLMSHYKGEWFAWESDQDDSGEIEDEATKLTHMKVKVCLTMLGQG
jgi:hypothetical protein